MDTPPNLAEIFHHYQILLRLEWLHKSETAELTLQSGHPFHNWINLYTPGRYHVIEVVNRSRLQILAQHATTNHPAAAYIFSDCVAAPREVIAALQQKQAALLQTDITARQVISEFSLYFAEYSPCHEHGVLLQINQLGVLLKGRSGIGKSNLALELIERGHQLVADDVPQFYRVPATDYVYGVSPPVLRGFLEVADLGVLDIPKLFGEHATTPVCPLQVIIELVDEQNKSSIPRLQAVHRYENILGVEIPVIQLYTKSERNMALMVETAIKNHILYSNGYDANRELGLKLKQVMKDHLQ